MYSFTDSLQRALNSAMPYVLDLLLAADLQRALDLELDRQTVRVPAGLARHGEPGHLLVAGEHVLVGTGEDVVQPGQTVGGRRPFVEHVRRRVAAHREAALEDAGALPVLEDLELRLGEARACTDR